MNHLHRLAAFVLTNVFAIFAFNAFGISTNDSYLTRVWEWEDGLPDNSIMGLAQSPDGFLWVATAGGLARFDGAHFEEFFPGNIPGGDDQIVRAQFLDHRGRLWLSLAHGIVACIELATLHVFTVADGLPDRSSTGFAEDSQGTVWIAYLNGDVIQIQEGRVSKMPSIKGLASGMTYRITADREGQVWFAHGKVIGVIRGGRPIDLRNLDETVVQISAARKGGIWIHSTRSLWRLGEGAEPERKAALPVVRDLASTPPMIEDTKGTVWIGTAANGLLRVESGEVLKTTTSHEEVTCLAEDREGNIWVGTAGGGLNRLRRRFITPLAVKSEETSDSFRSVTEDKAGRLWAVNGDGKVIKEGSPTWVDVFEPAPAAAIGEATCVAADREGAIWIGTATNGLSQYRDGEIRHWRKSEGLSKDSIRTLFASSNGGIWIGYRGNPSVQCLKNDVFSNYAFPESGREIRAIAEDFNGQIWIATAAGHLYHVGDGKLIREMRIDEGREQSIRCLHFSRDGSLWIGYAGLGIGRLTPKSFNRITTAQGLAGDYISAIASDREDRVWCTERRGLFHFRMNELTDLAEGRGKTVDSAVIYSRNEGVGSLFVPVYSVTGSLTRRDGRLCFPMRGGLAVLQPENLSDNPPPPPVVVERVVVDDSTVALYDSELPLRKPLPGTTMNLRSAGTRLRLAPGRHKVEFEFTAPSFTAPENVRFRYQLEGFDTDWQESGNQRIARYPSLISGTYHFLVAAKNEAGVWSKNSGFLVLTVPPFTWQTWWFRSLSLGLFTVIVISVARYVSLRRLREQMRRVQQQASLDNERTRIARDMHDTVGASLTQIGLLGELANRPSTPALQAKEYIRKITEGSHSLVQQLDEIVWAVDPENDTLEDLAAYVSQFVEEFFADSPIRCRVKVPTILPELRLTTDVRHNLFLAVREALNNVARHSKATEATVHVSAMDNTVYIRIEDNGHGFNVAAATARHGLENLKRRLAEIGGSCDIKSGEGLGTTIVFRWPCREDNSV